ncbi:cytokinin riboside 5'-monophosphate phosphoribohydrolase [Hypericibacter adhaerens]|uniref:Cytokinin riboside 5'-monophosphate phosphoribohydrolase n=1 Tax=Hypericibacter adhaerens TaxID=2602016 RepID=A0A5J6N0G6_9PROT|nr:cytokinin riboside 5'-monophosphate phosphoribohydrolase [Hypericibacter adhaerens]
MCVYCGSAEGRDPAYRDIAERLGRHMAANHVRLIYGGGRVGLMGVIADAVKASGGHVTGIIPDFLEAREVGNREIDELRVVNSMHARKQLMFELSDAFCMMPGGFGTLEEFFEVITWRQLGQHDKPIIVLNEAGYWDPLLKLVEHGRQKGFMADPAPLYEVVDRAEAVIPALSRQPKPRKVGAVSRM